MFDDLKERIRRDEATENTQRERIAKSMVVAVLSIFLFGGLYFFVKMVE